MNLVRLPKEPDDTVTLAPLHDFRGTWHYEQYDTEPDDENAEDDEDAEDGE